MLPAATPLLTTIGVAALLAIAACTLVLCQCSLFPKHPDPDPGIIPAALGLTLNELENQHGVVSPRTFANRDAAFRLGPQGAFGIDSVWLVVRLDEHGRVEAADIIGD